MIHLVAFGKCDPEGFWCYGQNSSMFGLVPVVSCSVALYSIVTYGRSRSEFEWF